MEKQFLIITKNHLIETPLSQLKYKLDSLRARRIEYTVMEVNCGTHI